MENATVSFEKKVLTNGRQFGKIIKRLSKRRPKKKRRKARKHGSDGENAGKKK